ncbi:MAG: flagellar basal body rod C-terminal domain-containing protein [Cyanobacteriota bacterium]
MNNYNLGLQNMRSVLGEMSIFNGNLAGSLQTGYKQSRLSYGGSGSTQINGSLQTPDTNLTMDHTSVDFGQGTIVNNGEKTDYAINGSGFFLLQQAQDVGVNPPNLLSRDGSFHVATITGLGSVLVNNNGLVALRDTAGNGSGPFVPLTQADLDSGLRPSILNPQDSLDSLQFSKMHGSRIFEFSGGLTNGDGVLVEGALEASNSDVAGTMAAMSMHTKQFKAMAAQIKVEQSSIDTVLSLFKT